LELRAFPRLGCDRSNVLLGESANPITDSALVVGE
jgi:hypothetical protein